MRGGDRSHLWGLAIEFHIMWSVSDPGVFLALDFDIIKSAYAFINCKTKRRTNTSGESGEH